MKIGDWFILVFFLLLLFSCREEETNSIEISIQSIEKLFDLPSEVKESSGLTICNDQILTHNDSGDTTALYRIDLEDGQLIERHLLTTIQHRDWEALAQNEDYLFIGDFGNNAGNRQDLKIYQVQKSDFLLSKTLAFDYAEQENFAPFYEQHNYNMEAMIATEEQLYLFSKNHVSTNTFLYSLPLNGDTSYQLLVIDTLETNFLVTDAAYDGGSKRLALVGYDNSIDLNTHLILIPNFDGSFERIQTFKFELGVQEQVEGITFLDENTLLISSEKEVEQGGNVYKIVLE